MTKKNANMSQFESGFKKTGFLLEFEISNLLAQNGWNVINNKLYIDDQQETVREIDIVAYKATKVNNFYVYTVLILSCKKSDKNSWVLFSKESNHDDPNMEWTPFHAWSNDGILSHMLGDPNWKKTYIDSLTGDGLEIVSNKPQRHIFGFQEMNKESGAPQNDKNIFNSITSVMKAQAYEMNALPVRKKDPCVFQFNLISVVGAELVRLDITDNHIKPNKIDDEIYVAEYIIDKQQTFSKIHFVGAEKFNDIIIQYNSLHESNKTAFSKLYRRFCDEITTDNAKLNLFKVEIGRDLIWTFYSGITSIDNPSKKLKDAWLYWDKKKQVVEFQLNIDIDDIETLNADTYARAELSQLLKKYYMFNGESKFEICDIPF
jgi:hypothetical protein